MTEEKEKEEKERKDKIEQVGKRKKLEEEGGEIDRELVKKGGKNMKRTKGSFHVFSLNL